MQNILFILSCIVFSKCGLASVYDRLDVDVEPDLFDTLDFSYLYSESLYSYSCQHSYPSIDYSHRHSGLLFSNFISSFSDQIQDTYSNDISSESSFTYSQKTSSDFSEFWTEFSESHTSSRFDISGPEFSVPDDDISDGYFSSPGSSDFISVSWLPSDDNPHPTRFPSLRPTILLTEAPSMAPVTFAPTVDGETNIPSCCPTIKPSVVPSLSPPSFRPSNVLSCYPSATPSANPNALSSVAPTLHPTQLPTGGPSANPSLYPAEYPSTAPSEYPTVMPTFAPSPSPSIPPTPCPSAQPTTSPTATPSFLPSVEPTSPTSIPTTSAPTFTPSFHPSSSPTPPPTRRPSANPTPRPSRQPTYKPTSKPTISPTRQPTSRPSGQPTHAPTRSPTGNPTIKPSAKPSRPGETNAPSSRPTRAPTHLPTAAPSIAPTIDFNAYGDDPLYPSFLDISNETDSSLIFPFFYYKSYVVGGVSCDAWKRFRSVALQLPFDGVEITSLTMASGHRSTTSNAMMKSVHTCESANALATILSGLSDETPFSISCDGHVWQYSSCSASSNKVLCVDCVADSNGCLDYPSAAVNPCRKGNSFEVYYSVVKASLKQTILYPVITGSEIRTTDTTATVKVNASSYGEVYCAAYPEGFMSLIDKSQIKMSGKGSILEASPFTVNKSTTTTTVLLVGLAPDTLYEAYCYTSDFRGNAMPIEVALRTRAAFRTDCCRRISIDSNFTTVIEYSPTGPAESVFKFSLNAQPEHKVDVSIQLIARSCSVQGSDTTGSDRAYPSQFTFTNNSMSIAGQFVVRGDRGCYFLRISSQTPVYESTSTTLQILPDSSDLPAPAVFEARFSNDGRKILVTFDVETDLGRSVLSDHSTSFLCSLLIDFTGMGNSKCTWETSSRLVVTLLYGGSSYVKPLDWLSLLPGKLRSKCPRGKNCQYFAFNSFSYVTIGKPLMAIYPIASLSTNAHIISPCSNIVLDPTLSAHKGGAGRPWESVKWAVSGNGANLTQVSALLSSYSISTSQLITIPHTMLQEGTIDIVMKIENFLGRTAVASASIRVVNEEVPQTSIFGPGVRSMFVWQRLELFAGAGFIVCNNNTPPSNSSRFIYEWTVFKGLSYVPSLQSTSNDPRAFKLDPYALDLYSTYTVVVQVTSTDESLNYATTYKVGVRTVRSYIDAIISGGDFFTVSATDVITLDGSLSVDKDFPNSAETKVQWTCVEVSPNFGAECPVTLTSNKILQLNAEELLKDAQATDDRTFRFTLRLTAYDGMFDEAQAVVVVSPARLPVVTFSAVSDKYDSAADIVIEATIESSDSLITRWNSTDVDLGIVATTSLTRYVSSGVAVTFQLGIGANTLFPGRTYSFQFLAMNSVEISYRTIAQLSIVINEPPGDGFVRSSPTAGYALNTSFFIRAVDWNDDPSDYPLKYVIVSFSEDSNKQNVLKTSTDVPAVTTIMSQGLASLGYVVTCLVFVSDVYGSEGSANTNVIVNPLPADLLTSTASWQLDQAFLHYNADAVTSVASSAAEAMNAVNCSAAPDCASLNRLPCKNTPHTCGVCKSKEFIGAAGDSNEVCFLSDDTANRRLSSMRVVGDSCSSGDICLSGVCAAGFCAPTSKKCSGNCSQHGTCVYYNHVGQPLPPNETCTTSDFDCVAKCSCDSSYYGRDCALSFSEFAKESNLRELMCTALFDAMSVQDISEDVVYSRARAVFDLLHDSTVVTSKALADCMGVLTTTVFDFSSLLASDIVSNAVLEALSRVVSLGSALSPESLEELHDAISILIAARQEQLATGSDVVYSISSNIRWSTQKRYGEDMIGSLLTSPVSSYEEVAGGPGLWSLSANSSDFFMTGSYGTTLFLSSGYWYFAGTVNATSPAARIEISDYSSRAHFSKSITIVIPNYRTMQYVQEGVKFGHLMCERNRNSVPYNMSVDCLGSAFVDESTHNIECPGDEILNVTYSCPTYSTHPACLTLEGFSFGVAPSCRVVDYSPLSVTCTCEIGSSGARNRKRRRLLDTSRSVEVVTIASGKAATTSNFTLRFTPSAVASTQSDMSNWNAVVIASFTSSLVLFVGGIICSHLSASKSPTNTHSMSTDDFFAAALPVEFSDNSWIARFSAKILETHDLIGLFHGTDQLLKLCRLSSGIITILFVDTLWAMYVLTDFSDVCPDSDSRDSCMSHKRGLLSFASGKAACEWNYVKDTCSYAPPVVQFIPVVILSMLVLISATPLQALVNFCLKVKSTHEYSQIYAKKGRSYQIYASAGGTLIPDVEKGSGKEKQKQSSSFNSEHVVLNSWESTKSKMAVAARQRALRNKLDKVSVADEAYHIKTVVKRSKPVHKGSRYRELPRSSTSLASERAGSHPPVMEVTLDCIFRYIFHPRSLPRGGLSLEGSPKWAERLVAVTRAETEVIRADIDSVVGTDYKQIVLLQHFLVHTCPSWKWGLAKFHLTDSAMFDHRRHTDQILYYIVCVLLAVYTIGTAFVVYYFATVMERPAVKFWIVAGAVSIAWKFLFVDTAQIYVTYIAVAEIVRQDVVRMHHRLRDMGEFIMNRGVTNLSLAQRRIHSLNPACRFARLYHRNYPLHRLLIQLNDYDIPGTYSTVPPYSSYACLMSMSFFVSLAMTSRNVYILVTEAILIALSGLVMAGLYNLSRVSVAIPITISALFILVVMFAVYLSVERTSQNKEYRTRPKCQVTKYRTPAMIHPIDADPQLHGVQQFFLSDNHQRFPASRSRMLLKSDERPNIPIPASPDKLTIRVEYDEMTKFSPVKRTSEEKAEELPSTLSNRRLVLSDKPLVPTLEQHTNSTYVASPSPMARKVISLAPLQLTRTPLEGTVVAKSPLLPKLSLPTPLIGEPSFPGAGIERSQQSSTLPSASTPNPFTPSPLGNVSAGRQSMPFAERSVRSDMMEGLLESDSSDEEVLPPSSRHQIHHAYKRTPLPLLEMGGGGV